MNRVLMGVATLALLSGASAANAVTINIFTDRTMWESAVGGLFVEETFDDTSLVPGLSESSTVGVVAGGVWDDQLLGGTQETEWFFSNPVLGFGGNWDTAGPGGPGGFGIAMTLSLTVGGDHIVGDVVPGDSPGDFYGLTSDTPFTAVLLQEGAGMSGVETYDLDNLVFSTAVVPEPSTIAFLGLGLLGLALRRRSTR